MFFSLETIDRLLSGDLILSVLETKTKRDKIDFFYREVQFSQLFIAFFMKAVKKCIIAAA